MPSLFALLLKQASDIVLDETCDGVSIRSVVFARVSRKELQHASDTVEALARPPDDNYYPELVKSYRKVRLFLPTLLRTVTFSGTQAGQPVLSALQFLDEIEGQRKPKMNIAPLEVVPPWGCLKSEF